MFNIINKIKGLQLFAVASMAFASTTGFAGKGEPPKPFSTEELLSSSSVPLSNGEDNQIKELLVFTHNDSAFSSKLEIIKKANSKGRQGDQLDLVYFIFDKDNTSAIMAQELIKAAQRGTKVRLLLDLHTNYKNVDYFRMLESEGKGNLVVSFYNRPSNSLILSATYLTLKCSKEAFNATPDASLFMIGLTPCASEKLKEIDRLYKNPTLLNRDPRNPDLLLPATDRAKAFLAGLYSKNPEVLGEAILEGQGIDIDKILAGNTKEVSEVEAAEKKEEFAKQAADIKLFTQIVYRSKFSSSLLTRLANKIALWYALLSEPEARNLYNKITGVLPLFTGGNKSYARVRGTRSDDFKHLTDYTHHKLLMLTGETDQDFQLGGRNVQNSYHIAKEKENFTDKYLFMDTDARIQLNEKNVQMVKSYDDLWNHPSLVIRLSETTRQFPVDKIAVLSKISEKCKEYAEQVVAQKFARGLTKKELAFVSAQKAIIEAYNTKCEQFSSRKDPEQTIKKLLAKDPYKACYKQNTKADGNFNSAYPRLSAEVTSYTALDRMADEKRKMKQQILDFGSFREGEYAQFSLDQDPNAVVTYVENTPFTKEKPTKRLYGSKPNSYLQYGKHGKNIHEVLLKSLRGVCSKETPQRVILHNAYFAPPSNVLDVFGKMVDGTWSCGGVTVDIITNSIKTTDLAAVNIFSRHAMKAFFDYSKENKSRRSAKFNLYEYNRIDRAGEKEKSLHSKVSVLGESDLLIGSANLDIRSYMMDTNNGVYIRNANNMVKRYTNFVDQLIKSGRVSLANGFYDNLDLESLKSEDREKLLCDSMRYGVDRFIKLDTLLGSIFNVSQAVSGTNAFASKSLNAYRELTDMEIQNGVTDVLEDVETFWDNEAKTWKTINSREQEKSQKAYDDLLKVI